MSEKAKQDRRDLFISAAITGILASGSKGVPPLAHEEAIQQIGMEAVAIAEAAIKAADGTGK